MNHESSKKPFREHLKDLKKSPKKEVQSSVETFSGEEINSVIHENQDYKNITETKEETERFLKYLDQFENKVQKNGKSQAYHKAVARLNNPNKKNLLSKNMISGKTENASDAVIDIYAEYNNLLIDNIPASDEMIIFLLKKTEDTLTEMEKTILNSPLNKQKVETFKSATQNKKQGNLGEKSKESITRENETPLENTQNQPDIEKLRRRLENDQYLLNLLKEAEAVKKTTEVLKQTPEVLEAEIINPADVQGPTLDVEMETLLDNTPQESIEIENSASEKTVSNDSEINLVIVDPEEISEVGTNFQSTELQETEQENINVLNDWDKNILTKGAEGVIKKILEKDTIPDVIILPETSARPLFYLLDPAFKKIASEKKISSPKYLFFSVNKGVDSIIIDIAEDGLLEDKNDKEYEKNPSNFIPKEHFHFKFSVDEINNNLKEKYQKNLDTHVIQEYLDKREVEETRAQSFLEKIKEVYGENPNMIIIDEFSSTGTTSKEIEKAFHREIPHYSIFSTEQHLEPGLHVDTNKDKPNPKNNNFTRLSYQEDDLKIATGVIKNEKQPLVTPARKLIDFSHLDNQKIRILRKEMRELGQEVAEKFNKDTKQY